MSGQTRRFLLGSRSHSRAGVTGALPLELPIHPAFRRLPPPLIVVGMHGSGSSIVSRILAELGVYMGANLDAHAEAAEFFHLNEELYYRAGAAWHRPKPVLELIERADFRAAGVLRLAAATYGGLRSRYLSGYGQGVHTLWGWKDPRNSLTLPLWLQLFPHARILHVLREPAQAAASINRRALRVADEPGERGAASSWRGAAFRALLYPPAGVRSLARRTGGLPPFPAADPCLDLNHCRDLAHDYVNACYRFRDLGGPRLEVRYEQLLERPLDTVQTLAAFTLGDVAEERVAAAAALVRKSPPAK